MHLVRELQYIPPLPSFLACSESRLETVRRWFHAASLHVIHQLQSLLPLSLLLASEDRRGCALRMSKTHSTLLHHPKQLQNLSPLRALRTCFDGGTEGQGVHAHATLLHVDDET